jgi:hypothetical protein
MYWDLPFVFILLIHMKICIVQPTLSSSRTWSSRPEVFYEGLRACPSLSPSRISCITPPTTSLAPPTKRLRGVQSTAQSPLHYPVPKSLRSQPPLSSDATRSVASSALAARIPIYVDVHVLASWMEADSRWSVNNYQYKVPTPNLILAENTPLYCRLPHSHYPEYYPPVPTDAS